MDATNSIITFVDYKDFIALEEQLRTRRGPASQVGFESWVRYDEAIRKALRLYGKVGSDANVDFYHGGDWFHELYDGFALLTPGVISLPMLKDLQNVVAEHHPNAVLTFGGDTEALSGFQLLLTPASIFATWSNCSASICKQRLRAVGVHVS